MHLDQDEISENVKVESLNLNTSFKVTINDTINNQEIVIYHANGYPVSNLLDLDGYDIYLDTLNMRDHTMLNPYQTIIAIKR